MRALRFDDRLRRLRFLTPRDSDHKNQEHECPKQESPADLEFLQRYLPADQASQSLGFDLAARSAVTDHSHQELAKAVVQFLDVSEWRKGQRTPTGPESESHDGSPD
jgi:hypothetical protein